MVLHYFASEGRRVIRNCKHSDMNCKIMGHESERLAEKKLVTYPMTSAPHEKMAKFGIKKYEIEEYGHIGDKIGEMFKEKMMSLFSVVIK